MSTLKDSIKQLAGVVPDAILIGTVKSVDKKSRTCDIEPINGDAEFYDVRLQAETGKTDGFVIIPKVGSDVMVGVFSDVGAAILLMSDIESVECEVTGKFFKVSSKGIKIASKSNDLKTEINDAIAELDSLCDLLITPGNFATGTGIPVVMLPQAITQISQKKVKLNLIKQGLNTILE